ncbi:hypothetical protein ABZ915_31780 [Streptomyces sp. NPDC046915]
MTDASDTSPVETPPTGKRPAGIRALLPDLAPWRASADFRKL